MRSRCSSSRWPTSNGSKPVIHRPFTLLVLTSPCLTIPFWTSLRNSIKCVPVPSSNSDGSRRSFVPNATSHNILDFRTFAFAQYRALALLCRTARQAIRDARRTLLSTHLVTSTTLSRKQFDEIAAALISNLQLNVLANEKRMVKLVSLTIAHNRVLSALRTNYHITSVPGSRDYATFNGVYLYSNESACGPVCDCRLEGNQCFYPAGAFYNWTLMEPAEPAKADPPPRFQVNFSFHWVQVNGRDDLPHRFLVCSLVVYLWTPCVNPLWNVSTINRASTPCSFDRRAFDPKLWISLPLASLAMQRSVRCSIILSSSSLGDIRRTSPLTSLLVDRHRFPIVTTLDSIWAGSSLRVSVLSGVWWSSGNWWHQHWFESGIDARPRVDQNKWKSKCSLSVRQEGYWRKVSGVCLNRMKVAIFVSVIVPHLHRTIFNFNIFSSDKPEEERVGILATRLYLILVLIGLLILGFYTSLVMRTQIRTITDPSLDQFEELNSLHASTLSCPCSRFSMSYARIMSLAPRYHQICSSQFLDKYWLSYFGRVEKDHGKVEFLALDFRVIGQSFFNLMRIFCQTSNQTVHDALRVFRSTRLATVNALSRKQFHLETSARLDQFQKQTIATFLDLIDLVRSAIQTNNLVTELWTSAGPSSRFDNNTSQWSLRFRARNFYTNSCSCALSNQCTRPVGFYLQEDNIYSEPNITVPGLVIGCYAIDSFLFSTLECLFDRECIQLIIDSYEFDAVDLLRPLDTRAVRIAPLQNNHSRFSPRTPMETIVSQLFIEDWSTSNNFTAYYNRCEPKQCTYSVRQRFDTAYMVAAMLGFYGGLSAILEIILPPLVKLVRSRWLKRRSQHPQTAATTVTGMPESVILDGEFCKLSDPRLGLKSLVRKVRSLNLFASKEAAAEELLATRIYVLLFALCLIAAFLYAGPLSSETKTIVTKTPTSTMVNDLHARNLSTLSCPCSKAAVNYSTFLSVTPHFHPICSSEFVLPALWADLFEKNDNVSLELSAHYRLLASLCERAYRTIENAQTLFTTREIISKETLTEPSFNHQIHAFLVGFIADLPADFRRKLSFTIGSFSVNQLLNRFTSNWQVSFTGEDEKFIIATHPRRFPASNCSCATSSKCFEELAPNVFSGCLPFDGFRRSTLHNLSTSELTNQLFVTHWYNTSNYTAYFETCRPLECQYTISDRQNLIYIFTTVLGLYGGKKPRSSCRHCNRVCILIDLGLTYGLRLIVDRALYIYRLWKYNPEQWSDLTMITTITAFLSFCLLSPRRKRQSNVTAHLRAQLFGVFARFVQRRCMLPHLPATRRLSTSNGSKQPQSTLK